MAARRDSAGRRITKYRNPDNAETAQWMRPRHPGPCAAEAAGGCSGYVGIDDVACLVKTADGWRLYHSACAPSWTYQPANEVR